MILRQVATRLVTIQPLGYEREPVVDVFQRLIVESKCQPRYNYSSVAPNRDAAHCLSERPRKPQVLLQGSGNPILKNPPRPVAGMTKLQVHADRVFDSLLRSVAVAARGHLGQAASEDFVGRKELPRDDMVLFFSRTSPTV